MSVSLRVQKEEGAATWFGLSEPGRQCNAIWLANNRVFEDYCVFAQQFTADLVDGLAPVHPDLDQTVR
jgi:hypothetical protein